MNTVSIIKTRPSLALSAIGALLLATVTVWADGGDPTLVHACIHKQTGNVRLVGPLGVCLSQETSQHWSIVGPASPAGPAGPTGPQGITGTQGPIGPVGPQGPAGSSGSVAAVIVEEHFDKGYLPATQWTVSAVGQGRILFPPEAIPGTIRLDTSSTSSRDSVTLRGKKQFSVNDGTLIFKAAVGAYHDSIVYGDGQPRGLAAGTDRSNAIEFVSAGTTSVYARTVAAGVATQTYYNLGETIYQIGPAHVYQIVATPTEVRFYINGAVVATHTTNIPTTPLNVLFTTYDGGFGTTPIDVDFVSFAIAR